MGENRIAALESLVKTLSERLATLEGPTLPSPVGSTPRPTHRFKPVAPAPCRPGGANAAAAARRARRAAAQQQADSLACTGHAADLEQRARRSSHRTHAAAHGGRRGVCLECAWAGRGAVVSLADGAHVIRRGTRVEQ